MRFDYLFKDTFEAVEAQVIQETQNSVTIKAVLYTLEDKVKFEKKVDVEGIDRPFRTHLIVCFDLI